MTEDNITTNVQLENGSPAFAKPVLCAGAVSKDGISLIHGDSLQALKSYGDNHFDWAIVDPPYGIDLAKNGNNSKEWGLSEAKGFTFIKKEYTQKDWDSEIPSKEYFAELKRVSKNKIVWGANFFAEHIGNMPNYITWYKMGKSQNPKYSDTEFAYCSKKGVPKMIDIWWNGFGSINSGEKRIHPTQKPVKLYRWVLENYTNEGDLILDTHLGSGSIAIACHQMKRKLIAYEIDNEYYEKACKRFEEQTRQTALWYHLHITADKRNGIQQTTANDRAGLPSQTHQNL